MNDKIKQRLRDPKFHSLGKQDKLVILAKDDPDFAGLTPEVQNEIAGGSEQLSQHFAPEPFTPKSSKPFSDPNAPKDDQGFLSKTAGKFADKFAPTALLQHLDKIPDMVMGHLDSINPLKQLDLTSVDAHPENYVPGVLPFKKMAMPAIEKSWGNIKKGWQDYQNAPEGFDKLLASGRAAVGAIPVMNESLEAGEKMIPPSGPLDLTELGSMGGDLANAYLPKVGEAAVAKYSPSVGKFLKNSSRRNLENILKGGAAKSEYGEVSELADKLNNGKFGDVRSATDESFLDKVGRQKDIRNRQNEFIDRHLIGTRANRARDIAKVYEPVDKLIESRKNAMAGSVADDIKDSAQTVRSSIDDQFSTLIPEEPAIPGKSVYTPDGKGSGELKEIGGSPRQPAARISKETTGKDLLRIRREAGETAAQKNMFKPGGPGWTPKIDAEGQAWKAAHKGAQGTLEDITQEYADSYDNMQRQGTVPKGVTPKLREALGKYGDTNRETSDLINIEKYMGRQKGIGTVSPSKYVLSRLGSMFGARAAGAEELSRFAGSTAYNTNMAAIKKSLSDMLMGKGLDTRTANLLAGQMVLKGQDATQTR